MITNQLQVLAFGIAKDIMGGSQVQLSIDLPTTVGVLKEHILHAYPTFQDVKSLAVAVNNEYSSGEDIVNAGDEVAIIPPVSGG